MAKTAEKRKSSILREEKPKMTAEQAIREIRSLRAGRLAVGTECIDLLLAEYDRLLAEYDQLLAENSALRKEGIELADSVARLQGEVEELRESHVETAVPPERQECQESADCGYCAANPQPRDEGPEVCNDAKA